MKTRKQREIDRKNREQHQGSALMTLTDPNNPISEQFRTIRTNIRSALEKQQHKTLMFTSSGAYEGKSLVAANVAVSMAQLDRFRVLYIDADLRKPTAHKTFDIHTKTGLSAYLTDASADYMALTHYVPEANVYVLPAGPTPTNPAELLSSRRMQQLLAEARQTFDLVIVDTPPVLVVADAQLIAEQVDAAVFVIREGVAQYRDVVKAKQILDDAHAAVLGVVYNGATGNSLHAYYGYGYGADDGQDNES